MKNCVLAVVLSAVVLFAWGFLSWAILPWHNAVANKFADESAVSAVLKENAPAAGMYYLPFAQEDLKPEALFALANVLPDGVDGTMGGMMGLGPARSGGVRRARFSSAVQNLDSGLLGAGPFRCACGRGDRFCQPLSLLELVRLLDFLYARHHRGLPDRLVPRRARPGEIRGRQVGDVVEWLRRDRGCLHRWTGRAGRRISRLAYVRIILVGTSRRFSTTSTHTI